MKTKGVRLILLGLLLIAAALSLMVYNKLESDRAGRESAATLQALRVELPHLDEALREAETVPAATPTTASQPVGPTDLDDPHIEIEIPDYILNPQMDMPEQEHEGVAYIAVLYIPALELELPVISEWNYDRLHLAPCRYSGSAYTDDLVIAGHAYETHFYPLHRLSLGDEVYLTDMDGNEFRYEIAEISALPGTAITDMIYSDYDLTLFTCTGAGSTSRLTVRCERS